MKRTVTALVTIAMVIAFFTLGRTNALAEEISFMYQGTDVMQIALKGVAKRFTAATGIKVKMIYAPHDVYQEKLAGAIAAKQVPDVVQLDAPFLSSLVWSGVLAPIEPYIDPTILADMTASNISQNTYPIDGKLYAISDIDSTVLLYGNKRYLEKIGARIPKSTSEAWSVEEFDQILGKLAQLPEVKYPLDIMRAYGVKSEWGTYGFFTAFLSGGGGIIDRKTNRARGKLNGPESVKVATFFQKWSNNGWIVPASAGVNMVFNKERSAAMAWCGNWYWAGAAPSMGDNLVAIPMPNFGKGVMTPNGTWLYAISQKANRKASGKFINFLLKDKALRKTEISIGHFPGFKSWMKTDPLYSTHMKIAAQQAETGVARPPHPAYPIITSAFMKAFANILDGADVQKTLNKAAREIDYDIEDHDGYPPFGSL